MTRLLHYLYRLCRIYLNNSQNYCVGNIKIGPHKRLDCSHKHKTGFYCPYKQYNLILQDLFKIYVSIDPHNLEHRNDHSDLRLLDFSFISFFFFFTDAEKINSYLPQFFLYSYQYWCSPWTARLRPTLTLLES